MRWIAGIDGGGSKTAVLLRTVDGKETRTCRVGSIDPAEYGVEGYHKSTTKECSSSP